MQEAGGQDLRFLSRPFISAELTHTYTIGKVKILTHSMILKENETILNDNYYITTFHLTRKHELMGE